MFACLAHHLFIRPYAAIRLQTGLAEQVQRIEALARNLGAAAAKAGAIATALSAEVFG
jgi:ABC-type spermidine/putrescine transport system permease subunit II